MPKLGVANVLLMCGEGYEAGNTQLYSNSNIYKWLKNGNVCVIYRRA